MKVAAEYIDALKLSALAQVLLGLFSAMVLDGGRLFIFWIAFTVVFWVMTVIMVLRRPVEPTDTDIKIVKYGYAVVFGITIFAYFGKN